MGECSMQQLFMQQLFTPVLTEPQHRHSTIDPSSHLALHFPCLFPLTLTHHPL